MKISLLYVVLIIPLIAIPSKTFCEYSTSKPESTNNYVMCKNDKTSHSDSYQQIMQEIKSLALPLPQDFFSHEKNYVLTSKTKQHYVFAIESEASKKTITIDAIYFENAVQVVTLLKKLYRSNTNIIPVLIDHIDDKETFLYYSTFGGGAKSVYCPPEKIFLGDVCYEILITLLYPVPVVYKSRDNSQGETFSYPQFFYDVFKQHCYEKKDFQNWWKKNKHLSFKQIQLNMIDWRIQEEEKQGFLNEQDYQMILSPLLNRRQEIQKTENGLLDIFPQRLEYYELDLNQAKTEVSF